MARRRFFVDRIDADRATLNGQDAHHLARVLRAEPGQRYEITDGNALYLAEIEAADPRQVRFRILNPLDAGPPLPPLIVLASLFKFDRFEWMVEKLTELGVKAILPVESARTDEGLFKAAVKRVDRWRKIAKESSQQSRRIQVPEIRDAVRLAQALDLPVAIKLRLEENSGATPLLTPLQSWDRTHDLAITLGPEGGWTDHERAAMDQRNWTPVTLGPNILRAETAAIAAVAAIRIQTL
jgi:16S rRNA (uracil1498-N3)-methyltransferase